MFGWIFVLIWLMLELLPRDAGELGGCWLSEVRCSLVTCYWYHLSYLLQLSTSQLKLPPRPHPQTWHSNQLIPTQKLCQMCQLGRLGLPSESFNFKSIQLSCTSIMKILLEQKTLRSCWRLLRCTTRSSLGWVVVYILIFGHWTKAWWSHYTWMVTIRVD